MKRCSKCGVVKPRSEYFSNVARYDSVSSVCKLCSYEAKQSYRVLHRTRTNKQNANHNRKYRRTPSGVARDLRAQHGLDNPTSLHWAAILLNDDTRCDICGIPRHRLVRLGFWKRGGPEKNRYRHSFDHITPGVNDGNYRALCFSCNVLRGDKKLTEAEVLLIMRQWYRDAGLPRKLHWLNTYIVGISGVGGTLYRNEYMGRKFENLRAGGE